MVAAQKDRPLTISCFFQQEHPADIAPSNHLGGNAFKLRYQRALPAIVKWCNDFFPIPAFLDKHCGVYTSPLFLPLVRSLLYPKHYFW
jgi:hypothetical protein